MPKVLGLQFALHDGERGVQDAADEQPPVLPVEAPWSAARAEAVFAEHRATWFPAALQVFADRIAGMLSKERRLSEGWDGFPGTDHPLRCDDAANAIGTARILPRGRGRLAVWHPPVAWVMPLVRCRPSELQVRLPLAGSTQALEAMARQALPAGWRRHRVQVRLDVETRVYWGARATRQGGGPAWKPCKRRGDGQRHTLPLFTMWRGQVQPGTLDAADVAPTLRLGLCGGVGFLVAVPVITFERARRWHHTMGDWWVSAWRRIGWTCEDDRDPTFVHRLEVDEPLWNAALGAAPLKPVAWRRALRDGALLRPASQPALQRRKAHHPDATPHVVLVHGGLASARSAFEALLSDRGAMRPAADGAMWPGMPLLDQVCTWRFEHDTFVPIRHNIQRLARWLQREVVRGASTGNVVLVAHSRGGNVVRFALPVLRQRFPGWRFSGITAGSPHLGTQVFSRIGRRWTGLAAIVSAVRHMTQGWLGREQLAQLVILERGLAYEVPPGFHDVEPEGVHRLSKGRPEELPEGLWLWGSEWGLGERHYRLEDGLWDWLVEDIGGAEVGGDGLVARRSALAGREHPEQGAHDASPIFHTRYFAHPPTRAQIGERLALLLQAA